MVVFDVYECKCLVWMMLWYGSFLGFIVLIVFVLIWIFVLFNIEVVELEVLVEDIILFELELDGNMVMLLIDE